jgi:hypothetical protein
MYLDMKKFIVFTSLQIALLTLMSLNSYSQNHFVGKWEGSMTCVDPNRSAENFKLDVWVENGIIRCNDHSSQNKFDPCQILNGQLHCHWTRSNSDEQGTYVFQLDPGNQNILTGYETTVNITCKKYIYYLKRIDTPVKINKSSFAGIWEGDTWCANSQNNKSNFKFDIWLDNGVLKCSDHSSSNKFYPCQITKENQIICNWYRSNSDQTGTYVFYFDNNNPTVLLGYENTHGVSCKQYMYRLYRKE